MGKGESASGQERETLGVNEKSSLLVGCISLAVVQSLFHINSHISE